MIAEASTSGRDGREVVTIVIVNWNAGELLERCIASVRESCFDCEFRIELVVVDNASNDGSIMLIEKYADVTVVRNAANRGFAAACNQGAELATGNVLLFLNPDCRVLPGTIEAGSWVLREQRSVGVAGVALLTDDGQVSRSCHHFPSLRNFLYRLSGLSTLFRRIPDGSMRDWPHDCDRRVDHVMGAFYMVRTQEFRELGGFDERFFVYLEDLDLSLRYRQRGQDCMFIASASAYHKGGGTSSQARAARLFYSTRSRILYAFKHFSPTGAWIHCVATLLVEPPARFVHLMLQGRFREIAEMLRGFGMVYRELPETVRAARRK